MASLKTHDGESFELKKDVTMPSTEEYGARKRGEKHPMQERGDEGDEHGHLIGEYIGDSAERKWSGKSDTLRREHKEHGIL